MWYVLRIAYKYRQLVAFGLVGLVNTGVDFFVFLALYGAKVPLFLANLASTTIAIGVSLTLNKQLVFRDRSLTTGRVVLFAVVTCTGLWVLQPLVMAGLGQVVAAMGADTSRLAIGALQKTCATVCSLLWNYTWYSRAVFAGAKQEGAPTNGSTDARP